eukprot:TRINITY_DN21096_c0_g1_i1.p1 TRINITY_DN21096_c0_g1~~TRINITY_DN21096_c0_g1_i1.p1  ORF type:complete len:461 (-),score=65.70 TRINITY_DN21096_c0_g1_i1:122-1444(-)
MGMGASHSSEGDYYYHRDAPHHHVTRGVPQSWCGDLSASSSPTYAARPGGGFGSSFGSGSFGAHWADEPYYSSSALPGEPPSAASCQRHVAPPGSLGASRLGGGGGSFGSSAPARHASWLESSQLHSQGFQAAGGRSTSLSSAAPAHVSSPCAGLGGGCGGGTCFASGASAELGGSVVPPVSQTLLVWDWDDTLMFSSAINQGRWTQSQAQQLEPLIEAVLSQSLRLGDTCIVTNADELWVLESTRRFAPGVMRLLSHVPVLSARRKWESTYPGNMFAWKRETFREILVGRGCQNLVVLGDSPAEMEAAHSGTSGTLHHPPVIKTVKFKELPTVDELLDQLTLVTRELPSLVTGARSSRWDLASELRSQAAFASALHSPFSAPRTLSASGGFVVPAALPPTTSSSLSLVGLPGVGGGYGQPATYVSGPSPAGTRTLLPVA